MFQLHPLSALKWHVNFVNNYVWYIAEKKLLLFVRLLTADYVSGHTSLNSAE